MINVNMYGLMPNKRIQNENLPIFRSVEHLIDGMKEELKKITNVYEEQSFSFAFPIEVIKSYETRVRVFASVPNMISDEEAKAALLRDGSRFQMRTYLILPYGEAMLIKNFDKIYENLDKIEDKHIRVLIEKFLRSELVSDIDDADIYHEYEFIYESSGTEYHGIIDLLIVKKGSVVIIDYKLKNLSDDAYTVQLRGYRDYIKSITDKRVDTYLYSIFDGTYLEVN